MGMKQNKKGRTFYTKKKNKRVHCSFTTKMMACKWTHAYLCTMLKIKEKFTGLSLELIVKDINNVAAVK